MKIALLCESPVDEAALRVLVAAMLAEPIEWITHPHLAKRHGGYSSLLSGFPTVLRALHFNSDVDGLVTLIDSDDSPLHVETHVQVAESDCRICRIENAIQSFRRSLKPPQEHRWRVALGLPVPCLEAWLLAGNDPHVGEAEWSRRLADAGQKGRETTAAYRRRLKKAVFGTDSIPSAGMSHVASNHARRLADNIDLLLKLFPNGFGILHRTLSTWRA